MKNLVSALFVFMLIGCSSGDSNNGELGDPNNITVYEGEWRYCDSTNTMYRYVINRNRITLSVIDYANSDCTGDILNTSNDPGSFSLGSEFISSNGVTVTEVNILTDNGVNWFDIWYLTGASLYHGAYTQGSPYTADLRPDEIAFEIEYIKQQ